MATFAWDPQTAKKKQEPKVEKSTYGDGYEQRVGTSINKLRPEWSLTFARPIAEMRQIDAFLGARAAEESFDWVDPDGNALTVVCDSWEYTPAQGLRAATISATFRWVPS